MPEALDSKAVAATNPAVELRKLEELARVRRTLESAGIIKRADYCVSPALGTRSSKGAS
jgi:hypothetical protein